MDLKVANILLGLTGGYSLKPCHLCEFNSRDDKNHYKVSYSRRVAYVPGKDNVKYQPLIDPASIIIPPLHVKLGLFKNLIKSLGQKPIEYLKQKLFKNLSDAKIEEGVLDGPDIRKLVADREFPKSLNRKEKRAFQSLVAFAEGFLGNNRESNYLDLAANLRRDFKAQGVHMSVKVHYAVDHVQEFPPNCGGYSDEQGERVHQDLMKFEARFKGHDYVAMLAEAAWAIKRDAAETFGRVSGLSKLHF